MLHFFPLGISRGGGKGQYTCQVALTTKLHSTHKHKFFLCHSRFSFMKGNLERGSTSCSSQLPTLQQPPKTCFSRRNKLWETHWLGCQLQWLNQRSLIRYIKRCTVLHSLGHQEFLISCCLGMFTYIANFEMLHYISCLSWCFLYLEEANFCLSCLILYCSY